MTDNHDALFRDLPADQQDTALRLMVDMLTNDKMRAIAKTRGTVGAYTFIVNHAVGLAKATADKYCIGFFPSHLD
jgi:hypothetical protein